MRATSWWPCVVLLAASSVATADPHTDGKTFAQNQLPSTRDAARSPVAQTPDLYIANPPQAKGYSSGVDLFGQGVGRINSCKSAEKSGDQIADQECEAVNFLAKNPSSRKKIDVSPNDPILGAIRDTMANASEPATAESVCVERTTKDPDEQMTKVCHEVSPLNESSCVLGRVVSVDKDSNYQCDDTYKALERFTCKKSPNINLTYQASCNLGSEVRLEQASSYLNGDSCKGGDKLVFSFNCAITDTPTIGIRILEGVGGGSYPENGRSLIRLNLPLSIDFEQTFSNCKAHVWGSATCSSGHCSGSYSAGIYVKGYVYENGTATSVWRLSGTLKTNVAFNTYTPTPELIGWINNCASFEERSK